MSRFRSSHPVGILFTFLFFVLANGAAIGRQNNTEGIFGTTAIQMSWRHAPLNIPSMGVRHPGMFDFIVPAEPPISGRESKSTNTFSRESMLNLLVGLSIPTGDFASRAGQNAGYAGPGLGLSAEYFVLITANLHWQISTSFSYNRMNEKALLEALGSPPDLTVETGSYVTLCPTTGFGFLTTSDDVSLYGSAQIGLLFGRTPEIKASYNGTTVIQEPSSSRSVAGVFSVGIITSRSFVVMLRYITGKPEYEVSGSGGGTSYTNKFEQGTSMLLILLGMGL